MPRFETQQLESIRRDNILFKDISFSLDQGELLQIDGVNGSGKSTLLRICAGLTLPNSGAVLWDNTSIDSNRHHYLQNMTYVGHQNGVKDALSVHENIQVIHALSGTSDVLDCTSTLNQVGLSIDEDVLLGKLSAGQKRRVGLCRLVLNTSQLWLLDEPFTSLDIEGKALIERLIVSHCQQGGMVIFATHQAIEIEGADIRHIHLGKTNGN